MKNGIIAKHRFYISLQITIYIIIVIIKITFRTSVSYWLYSSQFLLLTALYFFALRILRCEIDLIGIIAPLFFFVKHFFKKVSKKFSHLILFASVQIHNVWGKMYVVIQGKFKKKSIMLLKNVIVHTRNVLKMYYRRTLFFKALMRNSYNSYKSYKNFLKIKYRNLLTLYNNHKRIEKNVTNVSVNQKLSKMQ